MEIDKVHYVDKYTDKIRVPNGWLYRTICGNYNRLSVHTVFIPDNVPDKKINYTIQHKNNKR